jgi:integrase
VKALCKAAGVAPVGCHSLRGIHGDLAIAAGVTGPVVAAALGHESESTTKAHYLAPGTVEGARIDRVLKAVA